MWLRKSEYERLVSEAALALHVPKLELRAETAEQALAVERRQATADFRHLLSMWLRHERSYPLPPTAEEKREKKAEQEARQEQPPILTADQLARREAVRQWARTNGFTEEEADRSFMSQLSMQVDNE